MKEVGGSPGAGPAVCPFVALAEDRNRRADGPDKGSRCYAEPAPRQRDLAYQAEYCYAPGFSSCSVFLAWAARNAAEPAYVTEAAQKAWGSGIAAPEDGAAPAGADVRDGDGGVPDETEAGPTPEAGLFGPPGASEAAAEGTEQVDWVSASAWADAPWDERAEAEADERADIEAERSEDDEFEEDASGEESAEDEEATTGPKVPAALPMRRRRRPLRPIRTRGSGEWFYADPLDDEPLVKRRYSLTPPILLGVLALLVVALIAFLLPTLLSGGGESQVAVLPSPSPSTSDGPRATRAPVILRTPGPSVSPSPEPITKIRNYRVRAGDSLSGIAERFNVRPVHLQCLNGITNRNVVVLGARYRIPPDEFSCWPNWRNGATPPPGHPAAIED